MMTYDSDLDPEITKQFFENNVLKISPGSLNGHGLRCFERFFNYVNIQQGLLQKKRNGTYILKNINLIGYEYLWKVLTIKLGSIDGNVSPDSFSDILPSLFSRLNVDEERKNEMMPSPNQASNLRTTKKGKDPDVLFGENIGLSLQKVSNQRCKEYAKVKIQEILFQAQFGDLSIPSQQTQAYNLSSQPQGFDSSNLSHNCHQ